MPLATLTRVVAALLCCSGLATMGQAAVGVPENLILVRDLASTQQQFAFAALRTNSSNFNLPPQDPFFPPAGTPGGAFGDPLKFADINGDGLDDILAIQDARQFSTIGNPNDISDPGNILFDTLQVPALTLDGPPFGFTFGFFDSSLARVNGNVQFDNTDPTGLVSIAEVITRRDFDDDGFADTAIITDGNFFGSDVLLWGVQGTKSVDDFSSPLNPSGEFLPPLDAPNPGQPIFGNPVASESIPLVGDFNGDGVLDRAISNNAGLLSGGDINGRQIQVDISPAPELFGDGAPDNGISDVVGIADDDTIRVADINGDGLDDIVAFRPTLLDDGMGGMISTFEVNGYVNQGNVTEMGTDPIFAEDPNFSTFIGSPDLGDTIEFATLGLIETVPGDYNDDGVVNAADYTVYRDNDGQAASINGELPNPSTPGVFDQEDYDWWVTNYGLTGPPAVVSTAVPEPASLLCVVIGLASGTIRRRA